MKRSTLFLSCIITIIVLLTIMFVSLARASILYFTVGNTQLKADTSVLENEFSYYLKEEYGMEFTVSNVHDNGTIPLDYFGGRKYKYAADAVCNKYPEVHFKIEWAGSEIPFEKDTYLNRKKQFYNKFIKELWTYYGKREIEPFINKLYDNQEYIDDISIELDYTTSNIKDYANLDALGTENIMGYLEKLNGKAAIHIEFHLFMKPEDFNKEYEAERINEILNTYKYGKDMHMYSLTIWYINIEYKELYSDIRKNARGNFLVKYHDENKLINQFFTNGADVNKVRSKEYILNYFKL